MIEEKKLKVKFMPGCFDDFEGTQEELDELINEITTLAQSGKLEEMTTPIDLDDVEEYIEFTENTLTQSGDRKLH